jgi:hypothetical protein
LQLTSFRASILKETGGQIYSNNRLSRVAEQFGKALHQVDPGAADADCLRNAVNSFSYRDPLSLNPTDASLQVASAPHSFSRIMTGALFEAFAAMLKVHAKDPDDPKPDELLEISVHMRDIMANGVKRSAVRPNYYAEVAACITRESAAKPQYDPEYQSLFAAAFLRRNILSHETVAEITFGGIAQPVDAAPASLSAAAVRNRKRRVRPPQTALLAIPAAKYGLGEPLHVETSSHLPSFIARSAMTNGRSMELLSPDTAAMAFVDELFANSKVDFKGQKINKPAVQRKYRSRTHQIVRGPQGLHLERVMFSCGHCNDLLGW